MITEIRKQRPAERVKNFLEVISGYDAASAVEEASRCLNCKNPTCVEGCPVGIDIPAFIKSVREKDFEKAISKIKEKNSLPGVCGRVCPQESQCEKSCILAKKGEPVAIGKLERFAADSEAEKEAPKIKKGKKTAAVVGSGPASLACAAELALNGVNVTIFEALHKAGGVLRYGIPSFRLPRKILNRELKYIQQLGVSIVHNCVIGKTKQVQELSESHDAVFIGTGAGVPRFMGIPGEDLQGVYSANEYLTRVNLMKAHKFPEYHTPLKPGKKVVVIGGGNVAMDSARVAKRLGADVTVVYRRSQDEMTARVEEVAHAIEEGIKFLMLTLPSRIIGNDKVEGIECRQMMLGEEDETGRKSPVPIKDSEFVIECDQAIVAIGQKPNPIIGRTTNIETGFSGEICVDGNMKTSMPNVFAGGDIVSGSATVINAIADGKKAAKAIIAMFSEKDGKKVKG